MVCRVSRASHSESRSGRIGGVPGNSGTIRQDGRVASYILNPDAVAHAETLIRGGQYVLDSDWGEVQPHDLLQLLDRTSA
jgi:hypothetical protein